MKKESKLNLNAGDYAISHCDSDKTYNGLEVRKMLCDAYIAGSDDTLEDDDEKVKNKLITLIKMSNEAGGFALHKWEADEMLAWLEKQKNCIKLSDSAYTSNRDVIKFADKYSHTVWENLMDKFKKIENYSIGCNDVSDIVLNAIINTYNWLEKQGKTSPVLSNSSNNGKDEQKQEWSEEDERERKRVVGLLEGWLSTFKETCYAEDCKCGIDWLKSLRPQNRWKPTDEQMGCLSDAIEHYNSLGYPAPKLKELYEQLKKL